MVTGPNRNAKKNITYLLAENVFQVFNLPKTNIATKNGGFQ